MKLLVVEDEPRVASFLERGLNRKGHTVDTATEGSEGLELARASRYDVIILDVMLPDQSGFDVAATLREEGILTPVLMLTARDSTDDVVRGLDAGADDYLTKPFEFTELEARLRALGRRRTQPQERNLSFEDIQVDLVARSVAREDTPVKLTRTEFDLLVALMRSPGEVVERGELLERVWGLSFDPGTRLIDVHIANLRRKLEEARPGRVIATVRGIGFRLARPDED